MRRTGGRQEERKRDTLRWAREKIREMKPVERIMKYS